MHPMAHRFIRLFAVVFTTVAALTMLVAGCGDDSGTTCPEGSTTCSGECVDTQVDPTHCGTCGNACGADETCSAGACVGDCPAGTTDCDGDCVDTDTDPDHCGDCDTACDPGETCSSGQCEIVCNGGTTLCDGACVDTNVDPGNCGGCGDVPNAGDNVCAQDEVCSAGVCELRCTGGTTDCDGSCVDTQTDEANCGGCGDVPNVGDNVCTGIEECISGVCEVVCTGVEVACGGVCVNTFEDDNNCGGCGDVPNVGDHICTGGTICLWGTCVVNDPPLAAFPSGIVVSGAGTTGVNGVYQENGTHDGETLYDFDNGGTVYHLYYDSGWAQWNIGTDFDVWNAIYYSYSDPGEGSWSVDAGSYPAPTVGPNATITGHPYVDATVDATYLYSDPDNDAEGASQYQWYRCTAGSPATGCTAISGATSISYTAQQADAGLYLAFEVTPVAAVGANPGATILSDGYGPILDWQLVHEDADEFLSVKVVSALDGSIYVAYLASSNAAPKVFHYDGTTKTVLAPLTDGAFNNQMDLALNPVTGYPIVGYIDNADDELLRIREWDGTAWANLDYDVDPMVTWNVGQISMACDHSGAAIVSYLSDNGGGSPTYVARWGGSSWTQLGSAFAPDTNSLNLDVAVGPNNQPVYPHLDWPGHTIYRWDGTAWGALGSNFDSSQYGSAIQVDSSNTPILWLRNGSTNVTEVRQYTGGAWQMLGMAPAGSLGVTSNMEVSDVPTFTTRSGDTYTLWQWNAGASTWDSVGVFFSGSWISHDIAAVLAGHHYVVLSTGLILYK